MIPLRAALIVLALPLPALAQDRYQVTDVEKAACRDDAVKLCSAAPDEEALLSCMKSNVGRLTTGCRSTFVAGLRRRGLQ